MEDKSLDLVVNIMNDLKKDLCDFKNQNENQHHEIIARQDHTNGKLAELKKSQLILRGILIGAGAVLFAMGIMPQRLYDMLKLAF